MLHILVHVALQNSVKWSKQAHEAVPIDCRHLDLRSGDHIGCARFTLQQSPLAKVITWTVLLDLSGLRSRPHNLGGNRAATNDNVEVVTLFTLGDDLVVLLVGLLLDGVSDFAPLVMVDALQNGN